MEFNPDQFDPWAENYDDDVEAESGFPFSGYARLLNSIVTSGGPNPGETVLDLGCGTGNLGAAFLPFGCQVWGTDFSTKMIAKAQLKFPEIAFVVADTRDPLPEGFPDRFDLIVSAYVFHHFPFEEKIKQILRYKGNHLHPGGRILIGDLMFQSEDDKYNVASRYEADWDEEYYWVLDHDLPLMKAVGLSVAHQQISFCAGYLEIGL